MQSALSSQSLPKNQQQTLSRTIWAHRDRLIFALQPHLTQLARRLIRKHYRELLPKVLEARKQYRQKIKQQPSPPSPFTADHERLWASFRIYLREGLHESISGMVCELTDGLSLRLSTLPSSNLIVEGIKIYSSVTGSYQHRLTLLQKLSPNIRTLSYIESQMVQHSGDRELSGSIWVLLYIFSFAFVQMFGKYITREEKEEVLGGFKCEFVRGVARVVGGLGEGQGQEGREGWQGKVDVWIEEIGKQIAVPLASL